MGRMRCALLACLLIAAASTGLAREYPPVNAREEVSCMERGQAVPPPSGFAQGAARVAPGLVTVVTLRPARDPFADSDGRVPFRLLAGREARPERSYSSGFVLSVDGDIASSGHAVTEALATWVVLADGRSFSASVRGLDRGSDVALLHIDAPGLQPVRTATRPVCAGDWVAASGAPFGFDATVSAGVVSAFPRWLPDAPGLPLIQTDVALNPGSSGGPLFDAGGAVVGMSSMVYSATGVYAGVSFAVPIDRVLRLVAEWRARSGAGRPHIGLATQPMTPLLAQAFGLDAPRGALVVQVQPGGPAEQAGIRAGDVVLAVAGERPSDPGALDDAVAALQPPGPVEVETWRQGNTRRARVRVVSSAPQPSMPPAAAAPERRLGLRFAADATAHGLPPGLYVESSTGSSLLAGVEAGDRIAAVNGAPVTTEAEFDQALGATGDAPVLALLLMREDGAAHYVAVRRIGR